MSSLANAIKRITHKERSQPAHRLKLGLLEKHKDYVKRARNFHKKEKVIRALKRKAEERNEDEFYHAMEKARTKDGVHDGRLTQANKYTQEELRLMRTQDVKYLSLKATIDDKKAERMRESLHFIGTPAQNSHTVFVDDEKEVQQFDAATYFDTPEQLLDRSFNRPRTSQIASMTINAPRTRELNRLKYASYKALKERLDRKEKLSKVATVLASKQPTKKKGRSK
uniref:U3 small nucleolar RNA-associated protein 11 n=1 Tax=Polytomella parva TaxID=51329 RepID=A0A7S0UPS3_9CHLO|mmetsp:Transcript_11697/g.21030  ORF Transcript_11697/g.21030 Transcript_11697/m.21030 type:complete len:225 (+) Transcript_11697:59-733(+)